MDDRCQYITKQELLYYCAMKYNRSVMKGWLSGFFERNIEKIGLTKAIPQELTRLSVPRAYLNEHIANIKQYVVGKATELVFNIDEMGTSKWEDKKVK